METGRMLLVNKKTVGWSAVGPRKGTTVIHHYGWPSSSLEVLMWEKAAIKTGVRLISFDRPGIRDSSIMPEIKTADTWPEILKQCVGNEIKEFGVLGVSYGSPYALAASALMREQVSKTVVVAGIGDMSVVDKKLKVSRNDRMAMWLSRNLPRLAVFVLNRSFNKLLDDKDKLFSELQKQLSPIDAQLLENERLRNMIIHAFSSSLSGGAEGMVRDIALISRPWGFDASLIECPVVFYHGAEDANIPIGMSRQMSNLVSNSEFKVFPKEAHLSLIVNNAEDILKEFT